MTTHPIEVTVSPLDIEIRVGDNNIEVTTSPKTITLNTSSITTKGYIDADTYFSLNGVNGNVKFGYNSTTGNIEFYINGVLVGSFAKNTEENPFR